MLSPEVPSKISSLRTEVYAQKGVILHAVSLRQAFAHCGRFLTAASRRSMDRVAVPFWLVVLSDQLPVIDLVGRYPTNYLIGRRLLPNRKIFPLARVSGITPPFGGISLSSGQIPTCYAAVCRGSKPTRLACVRRTASVHSEPGSNSSKERRLCHFPDSWYQDSEPPDFAPCGAPPGRGSNSSKEEFLTW